MPSMTHVNTKDYRTNQMPKAEIASRQKTKENVIKMVKGLSLITIIIGACLVINNQTNKSKQQRNLNSVETPQLTFFGRMQDGATQSFEVPPSASLHDIYEGIESNVGYIVSLIFDGHTLPNDEEALIADAGISAECIIGVVPANDMQILERVVENPRVNLWPSLLYDALSIWPDQAHEALSAKERDALISINSYESFEAAARSLDMDVMAFAEKYCDSSLVGFEGGKIISFNARYMENKERVSMHTLSKLTELSELVMEDQNMPDMNLSALSKMRKLKFFELSFWMPSIGTSSVIGISIPDMSECESLEQIEFEMQHSVLHLTVDCAHSNLEKTKAKVVKSGQYSQNIKIL